MRRAFLAAVFGFCLALAAQAYSISEIAQVDRLLMLLDQRLRISEEVARAKWNSGAAVEDAARERQVLDSFERQAVAVGFPAQPAREVMLAQIEASKLRQRELMARWKQERRPPFATVPDLAVDIRPRLDEISGQLLQSLQQTRPILKQDPALLDWRAEVLWGIGKEDPARRRALVPWVVVVNRSDSTGPARAPSR